MLGLGNNLARGGVLGFSNTYSLEFDGTNDYVENAAPSGLPSGNTFTISAWVKVDSAHDFSANHFPILRRDEANDNFVFIISNTTPKIGLIRYGAETKKGDTTITDDVWHHVVVSVDNLAATFYLDGVDDGTQTFTGSFAHANEMRIGQYGADYAEGNIDEVAIWNTALSAGSISNIYNNGVPTDLLADSNSANLQGWWRMGDGDTFPTITDNSTNSNDGTMTNMASEDIVKDTP